MNLLIRVLLTFITAIGALYFTYWAGGALFYSAGISVWVPFLGSLAAGVLAGRYVWNRTTDMQPGLVSSVMMGALVTGAIGFSAGFFGPMILTPDANQGPLLGLFITGPLGFIFGAVGGAVHWFMRGRPSSGLSGNRI
jgi:hypothetical protein